MTPFKELDKSAYCTKLVRLPKNRLTIAAADAITIRKIHSTHLYQAAEV